MNKFIALAAAAIMTGSVIGCAGPVETETGFPATDFTGVPDFTSVEDFGYTSDSVEVPEVGEFPVFVVENEHIATRTLDQGGWFEMSTPAFEIDRLEDGGVVVSWDVRYPEVVAEGDRERAKFLVALTDAEGNKLYEFEYKPDLRAGEVAWNLRLILDEGEASTDILTARTRDAGLGFTPTGESAEWLAFEFFLYDDGDLEVLLDGIRVMYVDREDTHTLFNGLTFTYRTTDAPKNYPIAIRDLSVLPVSPVE